MTKQEALQWAFEYAITKIKEGSPYILSDILNFADQILEWYNKTI